MQLLLPVLTTLAACAVGGSTPNSRESDADLFSQEWDNAPNPNGVRLLPRQNKGTSTTTTSAASTFSGSTSCSSAVGGLPTFAGFTFGTFKEVFNATTLPNNTWTAGATQGTFAVNNTAVSPLAFPGFTYLTSTVQNFIEPALPQHIVATTFQTSTLPQITGKLASTFFGLDSLSFSCLNNTASAGFLTPVDSCSIKFTAGRDDGSTISQSFTITPSRTQQSLAAYSKVGFCNFYAVKRITISVLSSSPPGNMLFAMSNLNLGAVNATNGGNPSLQRRAADIVQEAHMPFWRSLGSCPSTVTQGW